MCWLLFVVRSTSVLPQWHVKDPGHSAESAGGRLHLNTHTPLIQRSRSGLTMPLSRHSVGTYPYNELTRNLSGNIRPQSSQLAEPLWTDSGLKSGISVREGISTYKQTKSAGGEWMAEHSPKIVASEKKASSTTKHSWKPNRLPEDCTRQLLLWDWHIHVCHN